jgi:hypothetical protein
MHAASYVHRSQPDGIRQFSCRWRCVLIFVAMVVRGRHHSHSNACRHTELVGSESRMGGSQLCCGFQIMICTSQRGACSAIAVDTDLYSHSGVRHVFISIAVVLITRSHHGQCSTKHTPRTSDRPRPKGESGPHWCRPGHSPSRPTGEDV